MRRQVESRPDPSELLRRISSETVKRNLFRVYLGYARGCGTTTAMLGEARRRASRGTDVVVGAYSIHGTSAEALDDLEVLGVPHARPGHLSLDPELVLSRNPDVVVVDDLAASDVNGAPVMDAVPRFLSAGITVLATVHLLSVRTVASQFEHLSVPSSENTVDDAIVTSADELELVDISPPDLVLRLRQQSVLKPAELARGLQGELRPALLEALRENAFRLVAEHADRILAGYLKESKAASPWEFRGRTLLCIPVRPGLEDRIRRAAQYAERQDAKFAVAIVRTGALNDEERGLVGTYTALTHQLGGDLIQLRGSSIAAAIVDHVNQTLTTEVILGHRRAGAWRPWDTTSEIIRRLAGVDVHILRGGS